MMIPDTKNWLRLLAGAICAAFGVWSLRTGEVLTRGGKRIAKADSPKYYWFMIIFMFGYALGMLLWFIKKCFQ